MLCSAKFFQILIKTAFLGSDRLVICLFFPRFGFRCFLSYILKKQF